MTHAANGPVEEVSAAQLYNEFTSLGRVLISGPEVADLFNCIIPTLEERVGLSLSRTLSEQKLDAFSELFDSGEEDLVTEFLAEFVPNYRDVVLSEFIVLSRELGLQLLQAGLIVPSLDEDSSSAQSVRPIR